MTNEQPTVEELQVTCSRLALKVEHYKQKVTAQEDQIADLRIEVTELTNRLNQPTENAPYVTPQEVVDAEVVPD